MAGGSVEIDDRRRSNARTLLMEKFVRVADDEPARLRYPGADDVGQAVRVTDDEPV